MVTSARYFDRVREMNAYSHRLRLVESVKQRGIKRTAHLFEHGPAGLLELSHVRHQQSLKTPPATEAQLVELRKTLPTFGARHLIREFDLSSGHFGEELSTRSELFEDEELVFLQAMNRFHVALIGVVRQAGGARAGGRRELLGSRLCIPRRCRSARADRGARCRNAPEAAGCARRRPR